MAGIIAPGGRRCSVSSIHRHHCQRHRDHRLPGQRRDARGADPDGDYAWLLFEKADALHPGAGAILKDKAQKLVGGPVAPKVPGGRNAVEYLLQSGKVAAFIGYCSGHEKTPDPRFVQVEVPDQPSVPVEYGLTVLAGDKPSAIQQAAFRFALYLMSPPAQALLGRYGFIAVTADLAQHGP